MKLLRVPSSTVTPAAFVEEVLDFGLANETLAFDEADPDPRHGISSRPLRAEAEGVGDLAQLAVADRRPACPWVQSLPTCRTRAIQEGFDEIVGQLVAKAEQRRAHTEAGVKRVPHPIFRVFRFS